MLSLFIRGHRASCPAPRDDCTCEWLLYLTTCLLALLAGGIGAAAGEYASATVFSDAPHSWVDGAADFGAMLIVLFALKALKRRSDRIFAALLAVAIGFILYHIWERMEYDRAVVPPVAFFASVAALLIDGLRWHMLHQADKLEQSKLRHGLIPHAKSDFWHSAVASVVTGGAWLAAGLDVPHAVLRWADISLSAVLVCYVSYLTWGLWAGKEHHHGTHKH